jgi:hypothetical protein
MTYTHTKKLSARQATLKNMLGTTFLTLKFPLRFSALLIILFLFIVSFSLTYKASIELWDFFTIKNIPDRMRC